VEVLGSVLGVKNRQVLGPGLGLEARVLVNIPDGNSDRNVSVRPSVCPSVTRWYCVKTKKANGMISSPSGSPKTLVF